MKRITLKLAVAFCTFIIGIIVAAAWFFNPAPIVSDIPMVQAKIENPAAPISTITPDSTVYSVRFCELIRDSEQYNGKIVRIQAFYERGIDTAALTDPSCKEWLRPNCNRKEVQCENIWSRMEFSNTKVDMVGRYTADIADPNPLQNSFHVRLFQILELKDAKPANIRER